MNIATDTIVALATPPGRGGVGIVRVSGPLAPDITRAMLAGAVPAPRRAEYLPFHDADGGVIDTGIALYFPAPHSFTGEDVLELQGHGGPVVLDLLIRRILALGARPARPGEFSERAFLNDKIDLVQAEAIADLIDSASEQAARAASRSLQGEFSARVNELIERLIALRMYVESAIDFPEEEIDFLSEGNVGARLDEITGGVRQVLDSARQGSLLREGMTVVIAGRPNAGKSSLLNRLACRDAAIVTNIPGTTRDVLREHITLDGLPLHIIDTAGLRDSDDPVEQQGIQRAWGEIARADRLLLMIDDSVEADDEWGDELREILRKLPQGLSITVVRNKIDLSGRAPGLRECAHGPEVALSAQTGEGIEALREHLKVSIGYGGAGEGGFMARRRHIDALRRAHDTLENASGRFRHHRAGELLAEDLRQTQDMLSEITGEFGSDELLGRIFSSFCIGK
ncbi:MAG: tRNA uridine-5-carboxymethylaminomethyl(34) synthesis GTPase MnmE [Pseudomonadota bacterium]